MVRITEQTNVIPDTSPDEQPAPGGRANGLANPPGQLREALTRNFPYVLFDVPPDSDGDITVRKIGAHAIAHLRSASWTAEATVGHADALGFGETVKLVWLLNGTMTYEDRERAIAINRGELFVTRSSSDYFLKGLRGLGPHLRCRSAPRLAQSGGARREGAGAQAQQCCGGLGG